MDFAKAVAKEYFKKYIKSAHDTKVVCISVSLLLWSHWTQETGVASRSDFTPYI